jgi:hypothetical protein
MIARNKVYYTRKNFGGLGCAWTFVLAFALGCLLLGRNSWMKHKIMMRAFMEGLRPQMR